jgi:hypothetical protein
MVEETIAAAAGEPEKELQGSPSATSSSSGTLRGRFELPRGRAPQAFQACALPD